jgi:hypothetical protein
MNSGDQERKEGNGGRRGDPKEKQRMDRHDIRHCTLFRLLYQQVIEADDESLGALAKSDLYGCEHLLRLFFRLPPIMADQWKDEDDEEVGLILAKINDLVRFLHKH